ncbi:MAG: hypothetical protein WC449_00140 [Candidatus Paceibacterota bacterium]
MPGINRENIIDEFIALHLQGKTEDQISSVLGISKAECQEMGRITRAILASAQESKADPEHLKKILLGIDQSPVTNKTTNRNTNKEGDDIFSNIAAGFQNLSWQYKLAPVLALCLVVAGLWILNIPQRPILPKVSDNFVTDQADTSSIEPLAKMEKSAGEAFPSPAQDAPTDVSANSIATSEAAPQMLMTAMAPSPYSADEISEIDNLLNDIYIEDGIISEEGSYIDAIIAQDQSLNQYEEITI